jgi:hypothetical protein
MDQLPGGGVSDFQDIARVSAELAVTVGIIEAAIMQGEDTPDEVKENFTEKVDGVVEYLHNEVLEFQGFGEAYDDEAP